MQDSLRLFGKDSGKNITGVVISSNYTLGVERPADPSVAVYFTWDGLQVCIPVDRYRTHDAGHPRSVPARLRDQGRVSSESAPTGRASSSTAQHPRTWTPLGSII